MFKKLSGIILSFALVVSLCQITTDTKVYAAEDFNSTQYYVGETTAEKYWSQFSSWYYYELMDAKQKVLYMDLYNQCMDYLTSNKNIDTPAGIEGEGWFPEIEYTGISEADAEDIVIIFRDNNPQFWFLSPFLVKKCGQTNNEPIRYRVELRGYEVAKNGATRGNYTAAIKGKVDAWLKEIKAESNYYERVKKAYDIVMREIEYDDYAVENNDVNKHQTVFTAITQGKSVCAGYSELLAMLCNGAGIDCITVTSEGHEWCQVRYQNNWYSLDPTFDDSWTAVAPGYKWLLKNDATFKGIPSEIGDSHVPEARFNKIRPICRYNWEDTPDYEYTEVFRLFNRKDGRRLNTVSSAERDETLLDPNWILENSPGFSGVDTSTGKPVYSLIHLKTGKQLYTADENECKQLTKTGAWIYNNDKAPVFYSVENGGKPLFRLFNTKAKEQSKAHLYTSDFNEINKLLKTGWVYDNDAKPVFRFISSTEL